MMNKAAKPLLILSFLLISLMLASNLTSPVEAAFSLQKVREIPAIGGVQSVIVIPVKFKGSENTVNLSELEERVFNQLNRYFANVSYGKVTLTGEVAPQWYQLTRGEEWYGSRRERWESLVYDAIRAGDRDVNYREYDFALIVHTGENQDRTLQEEQVTSFGTYLRARFLTRDGVVYLGVSCLSEFDPIGPYAHYLALNMGLPSLYIDNMWVGEWGLMAHGFWADNGSSPVNPLSYSKIRAGWIDNSSMIQVLEDECVEAELSPLSSQAAGIKAVKIPVDERQYYLLEARRKTGYDSHLPDEGVLLTFIDESKKSGEGVVKVVDNTPDTETLDDAPLKPDDAYNNSIHRLTVNVVSSNGEAYNVLVDRGEIEVYSSLEIETGIVNMPVVIDDATYHADEGGVVQAEVDPGSHTVQVHEEYNHGNGTKSIFKGWSDGSPEDVRTVDVEEETMLQAQYSTEHHIVVRSDYGGVEGGGWYNHGEKMVIRADQLLEYGNGTRRVFEGWSGIVESTEPQLELTVQGPGEAYARWETQYQATFYLDGIPEDETVLLTVNGVESNLAQGETYTEWYPQGAVLMFGVEPKSFDGLFDKTVFQGLLDDNGENITSPITIDEPLEVVVQYSKTRVSYVPESDRIEEAPEKAREIYHSLRDSIEAMAVRNPISLNAYVLLASPTVWALSVGTHIHTALPLPAPFSTAISAAVVAVLLGLIYLFPLTILVVFLGCRRRDWRPRLKTLTPILIPLFLGWGLVLVDGLWLSASSAWGWLGLIMISLAALLLTSLGLTVILARGLFKKHLRTNRHIPGFDRWK